MDLQSEQYQTSPFGTNRIIAANHAPPHPRYGGFLLSRITKKSKTADQWSAVIPFLSYRRDQLALRSLGRIRPPTIVLGLVDNIDAAHIAHIAIHRLCDASEFVTRTRITRCILREQHGQTADR